MYNVVVNFLNTFNLISYAQDSFRENKSTFAGIQTFTGEIQKTLDNKQPLVYFWIYQRLLML
jgi:hypothetical protein